MSYYGYAPAYSEADLEEAFLLGYKDASEEMYYDDIYYDSYLMGKEAGIRDVFSSLARGGKSLLSGAKEDTSRLVGALKNTKTYQGAASGAKEVGGALKRDVAETASRARAAGNTAKEVYGKGRDAVKKNYDKGRDFIKKDIADTHSHAKAVASATREGADRYSRNAAGRVGGFLSRMGDRVSGWANRQGKTASDYMDEAFLEGYYEVIDDFNMLKAASVVEQITSDYMYQNLQKVASEWEQMVKQQVY